MFRNILRSVLIAVPLVTLLYLCVNTAYLTALTVPQVILQPAVAVVSKSILLIEIVMSINMN